MSLCTFSRFTLRVVFGCAGSPPLCWLFSGCSGQGLPFGCGAQDAGSGSCGSPALEHRLGSCDAGFSFSVACEIFLDQRSNLCLLRWQAASLPPSHQGSHDAFSSKTSLLLLSLSPLLFLCFSVSLLHTQTHTHTYTFYLLVSLFFSLF